MPRKRRRLLRMQRSPLYSKKNKRKYDYEDYDDSDTEDDHYSDAGDSDADDSDDIDDDVYEVETILDHRIGEGGQIEYLIKWRDYSMEETTWEIANNLLSCETLLEEYNHRLVATEGTKMKRFIAAFTDNSIEQEKEEADDENEKEDTAVLNGNIDSAKENTTESNHNGNEDTGRISEDTNRGKENTSEGNRNGNENTEGVSEETTGGNGVTQLLEDVTSSDDRQEITNVVKELVNEIEMNGNNTGQESSQQSQGNGSDHSLEPNGSCGQANTESASSPPSSKAIETGWDRGLVAKKVLGVTRLPDESLWILVAWRGRGNDPELVPNYVANEKIPDLIIAHYEKDLRWEEYSPSE